MVNDKGFRIGNRERESALDALSTHFADGYLDVDEFDRRTAAVVSATHQADLVPLFEDLPQASPHTPTPQAPAPLDSPYTPAQRDLVSEQELAEIKRKGEILKKTDMVTVVVMAILFISSIVTSQTWLLYVAIGATAVGLIGARAVVGISDAEEDIFEEIDAQEQEKREERLRLALKRRKELGY